MNKSVISILMLTMLFVSISCNSQNNEDKSTQNNQPFKLSENKANILYFHYTRRCATCLAIEAAGSEIAENNQGNAIFKDFNLDEEEDFKVGVRLSIEDQAFVIISGDKQVDLTEEAFLYANSDPEKFKSIIQDNLNKL